MNTQNLKYTRIFDMENNNDKLCYKKCCNDERADALKNDKEKSTESE